MNRTLFLARWSVAIMFIGTSVAGQADTDFVKTRITQIVATEAPFGGCMVALSDSPQDVLPSCKATYATLSCDGSLLTKEVSKRLMTQAQIAFALDKKVKIFIDDSRRQNGYCLAYRIDVTRQ